MTEKEYRRRYYRANRERLKAKSKARYRSRREECIADAKRLRAKNQMLYRELGEKPWQYRKRHGLSQQRVAEICGVTQQTVSNWETGSTPCDFGAVIALIRVAKR